MNEKYEDYTFTELVDTIKELEETIEGLEEYEELAIKLEKELDELKNAQ